MMLRANVRRSAAAATRRLSTQRPDASKASVVPPSPPQKPALGGGSAAGKAPVAPPSSTPSASAAAPSAPSSSSSSSSSSSGPGFGTLLLFTALSAPAGAAVYLKQNPEWNPDVLRNDANWIKFRELVLGDSVKKTAAAAPAKPVVAKQTKPKEPSKTPEELSAIISKANPAAALPAKAAAKATETAKAAPAAKAVDEKVEKKQTPAKNEKKADVAAAIEAKKEEAVEKAEKAKVVATAAATATVAAAVEIVDEAKAAVEKAVHVVEKAVDAAEKAVDNAVEKVVDDAVAKERKELEKLTQEATASALGSKIVNQIQSTTKEIVQTLQAEANEAAFDVDKNYLNGIHELDANALAIRVAQLATEMKHRSKWEAVRLLEALRRMEEDAKKKSAEILERQQTLHKELLERELRLQDEILTRKTRDEMHQLKKQYAEDLSRNVQKEKTSILKTLQEKFAADKKAIEDKYAQQLKTKSETFQETLTKERKQRVEELENYRAQLRALNAVLERTSTYEAFSHQVHKASMAALALSDRIEAAGPLRTEIRALREFARNDPFVDVALKSLPEHVIDEGAPSVSQLQERFKNVKAVGRRAAMLPEGSGLVGQLFGGALSYLIIPPGGPIEGSEPDAVFSRADYALKAGDIEQAVSEMKTLTGLPAEVSRDWVAAAEDRLAIEQTAKVVKAHISLLAASCS